MPNDFKTIQERLDYIFFPHQQARTQQVIQQGGLFVHYTTAEKAAMILKRHSGKSPEIWLRGTRTMNDYLEIDHGVDCLARVLESPIGKELESLLNSCLPDLHAKTITDVDQWLPHIRSDTYIFCASEHIPQEHQYGRLSMWRAYGNSNGVALVFRGDVMFSKTDVLHAYAMPVHYATHETLSDYYSSLNKRIGANLEFLKSIGKESIEAMLFALFQFSIICTKHPGFEEEREWRIIYSPILNPSDHLETTVECVWGIPQKVAKLRLQDMSPQGLPGLALPELLDRIIIGPCRHPHVVRDALTLLLKDAGVPDPETKVTISDIPLRTY